MIPVGKVSSQDVKDELFRYGEEDQRTYGLCELREALEFLVDDAL